MAKFNIGAYWSPTPKKIRKIGLAIASLGATIGTGSGVFLYFDANPEYKSAVMVLAIASPVLGWIGKEITNFWTEEEPQPEPIEPPEVR